jgi:hypothetical protein
MHKALTAHVSSEFVIKRPLGSEISHDGVDFHSKLTQFFISGRPTHVLILRRVSKWLVSSSAGHVPTKIGGQLSAEINSGGSLR